jgi:hypothetical protein
MIILSQPTDKLQVLLDNAVRSNQLQCTAAYRDSNASTFSPNKNATNTNNTTAVDLVGSPSSGIARGIDYLSIFNIDTAGAVVTVRMVFNSTNYTLWKGVLNAGDKLEYTDSLGFIVKSATISSPVFEAVYDPAYVTNASLNRRYVATLDSDYTVEADTGLQVVHGLGFPVYSSTLYYFQFTIRYQTDATTTGTAHSITGPPFSYLVYDSSYSLAATTVTTNENLVAVGGGVLNTDTANTPNARAIIRGVCIPSTAGFVWAEVNTETSLLYSGYVRAGSFVEWYPVTFVS